MTWFPYLIVALAYTASVLCVGISVGHALGRMNPSEETAITTRTTRTTAVIIPLRRDLDPDFQRQLSELLRRVL